MALLPLAWLVSLAVTGRRRDAAWWWLAGAFAVSWLADTAADLLPRNAGWVPSLIYPVAQTTIVAAVLLPRRSAWWLLSALVAVGLAAAVHVSAQGPDILLRSVADLIVVAILAVRPELPNPLRLGLFIYFGLGWIAWMLHAERLSLATWYPYQVCRLAGLILVSLAATHPTANLRVME
jgi:hypothetical protein